MYTSGQVASMSREEVQANFFDLMAGIVQFYGDDQEISPVVCPGQEVESIVLPGSDSSSVSVDRSSSSFS